MGPSSGARGIRATIRRNPGPAFVTEESVYGTILITGLIAAASGSDETSWAILWSIFGTAFVFWAAHVYAGTVARHGVYDGKEVNLRHAFGESLRHSSGLLTSTLIPACVLLLGVLDLIPDADAIGFALWSGVAILTVLGYVAFAQRGSAIWVRICGAAVTGAFGVIVVVLKALLH